MISGKLFINGRWTQGAGDEMRSLNPANNQLLWQGNGADESQVNLAINAARTAFNSWSALQLESRLVYINAFADLLEKNKVQFAQIISCEMGKPNWEALTEIAAMKGKTAISINAYNDRTGTIINQAGHTRHALRHKPHGVLAIYGPYNFPGHLPNGHIIPALIAGNTVVFKPSELTPHVAEFMIDLWQQTGLPAGVLNLLQGEVETGKVLAAQKGIDGLLFTGSAQTGKLLHEQFSGQPEKILALEMGGNNPLIVLDTSNIKALTYTIIQSAFITSGQRCTCARRLYIPKGTQGDLLIEQLVKTTARLKVGAASDRPEPFMGPVISSKAAENLINAYHQLIRLGGTSLLKMNHLDGSTGLISAGIVDVTSVKHLADDEHFGPLLQIIRYSDFEQAIDLANDTRFGLAAGLLGGTEQDYALFHRKIRAGIVNWNRQTTGASSNAPFGGIGVSGNHRASAYYAADYCAYPIASLESTSMDIPENLPPGLTL